MNGLEQAYCISGPSLRLFHIGQKGPHFANATLTRFDHLSRATGMWRSTAGVPIMEKKTQWLCPGFPATARHVCMTAPLPHPAAASCRNYLRISAPLRTSGPTDIWRPAVSSSPLRQTIPAVSRPVNVNKRPSAPCPPISSSSAPLH